MLRSVTTLAAACILMTTPAKTQENRAAAAFAALSHTVGEWRPAENSASPLRVRFSLTAGGSVLVEQWTRNGAPHSLTVYHRDGEDLIAIHYCPQGNQPRLMLQRGALDDTIRFDFRDATDLDADEAHVVNLAFDLSDPTTMIRSETYRAGGTDEPSVLRLVRAQ